jgi:phage shock protein C
MQLHFPDGGIAMESYRKLYRSTDKKMITGVASGLGDYLGIDPTIVRIIFVATVFFGGAGIPIYLLMSIFVPRDPLSPRISSRPGIFGLLFKALGIIICLALISHNFGSTFGAVTFAIGLAVGLYFYWRSRRGDADEESFTGSAGFPSEHRFHRSVENKKILGVFGGLAEVLGVDATLLRIAGGVLLFAGGPVTIAFYLLAGLLMPKREIMIHID